MSASEHNINSRVYSKPQISFLCNALSRDLLDRYRITFKQRKNKWYITISCIGPDDFICVAPTSVQSRFPCSYMTSGCSSSHTVRVGSTETPPATKPNRRDSCRSHTLRTALFGALVSKFSKDGVNFDIDYMSDVVDTIVTTVSKHNTK